MKLSYVHAVYDIPMQWSVVVLCPISVMHFLQCDLSLNPVHTDKEATDGRS